MVWYVWFYDGVCYGRMNENTYLVIKKKHKHDGILWYDLVS